MSGEPGGPSATAFSRRISSYPSSLIIRNSSSDSEKLYVISPAGVWLAAKARTARKAHRIFMGSTTFEREAALCTLC
jgi:hypothetical protein